MSENRKQLIESALAELEKEDAGQVETAGRHLLLEMALVGRFTNRLEAYVHTNDPGKFPHFHIRDIVTRGREFHCCVKILVPEYFVHGKKRDKLNGADKAALIEFLNGPHRRFTEYTNWAYLVNEWNINNSELIVPDDAPMPDYSLL